MKFNRALALALSLAPLVVSAAPADGLFNTLINGALGCPIGVKERAQTGAWRALNNLNLQQTPTIEAFCATLRAGASEQDARCYSTCETDYASAFARSKEESDRSVREHQASQERERAAEQAALAKKQAAETRVADLKAGRVQPDTLEEAALVYGAKPGASLAAGPKIRADGAIYYLYGKIKVAGEAPEFMAATSASQTGELQLAIAALQGVPGAAHARASTDYFKVIIPKQSQAYYFERARIDGGFDLIGRYVANTKYTTVGGQERTAPVFEVVYIKLW